MGSFSSDEVPDAGRYAGRDESAKVKTQYGNDQGDRLNALKSAPKSGKEE